MSSWTVSAGAVKRNTWVSIGQSPTGPKLYEMWRCSVCKKLGCTGEGTGPPSTCCCQEKP